MGKLEGKVAFITGAARGQGRSHAIRLAQEGADIIAIPSMIERGEGGAIVLTSSTAGINGIGGPSRGGLGYTAAKHGVVGLMRSYANNLAPHRIRVNSIHPTGVNTPMVVNEAMQEFLAQDPSLGNAMANALPVDMVEAVDISNAIVWLVSDDARYVTGVTLPVDAGFTNKK
jgi:NAD(P)-dependent dehydrogenase (short-subunit alcohol dehydrogenase family)